MFLALVLLCWLPDARRLGWGQAALLAILAPFLVWLTVSPGIGPRTLVDCLGYSAVLLPTALAALHFRSTGVPGFSLYGLLVGLVGFRPGAAQVLGVSWHTLRAVTAGLTLAWLLDQIDQAFERLEHAARRDSLTGLGNRRAFELSLEARWQLGPEEVGPFC